MSEGLYQKYRPRKFSDVLGQDVAVGKIKGLLKGSTFPKALMFSGPPGVGKTTLARILAARLNCLPHDLFEVNCSDDRGIDMVRGIAARLGLRPSAGGERRVWILDECQALTPEAQGSLLKYLEEAPKHVNFMLATTNPEKMREAIRSRCSPIDLKSVPEKAVTALVLKVAAEEGAAHVTPDVAERIAVQSRGGCREALNLLESVIGLTSEEEMLQAIARSTASAVTESLAQLLFKPGVTWGELAEVLREIEDGKAESVRRGVLGYAQAIILNPKTPPAKCDLAEAILSVFQYDIFASGKPGLTLACRKLSRPKK